MKAVVLFSGGMDSATVLTQAIEDGNEEVLALTCWYGSKHNDVEMRYAAQVVEWLRRKRPLTVISHETVTMPTTADHKSVFRGGASALLEETHMPQMSYQEIEDEYGPSPTVVPFRNANLIGVATAIAAAREYDYVYVATHAEDARNWAYPDCTPEFMGAMANAVYIGTYQRVRLKFPFTWMMKSDIVTLAAHIEAPLGLTYSCYEGKMTHCGRCPTCVERIEAFKLAGYIDPTSYVDLHINESDGNNYFLLLTKE